MKTVDFEIQINFPPEPTTGLAQHPISENCTISASGSLFPSNLKELASIRGSIGSGREASGTVAPNKRDWSIDGIGPAYSGVVNTVMISGTYTDGSGATPATREFMGIGGGSSCFGSSIITAQDMPARRMQPLLPRFYRLSVDEKSLQKLCGSNRSFLGGLLQSSYVYLAYDPVSSKPNEPVWRDINLPSPLGSWVLRLSGCSKRTRASLMMTRITDTQVYPPLTWSSDDWRIESPNAMYAEDTRGSILEMAVIWVEPS